MACFTKIHQRKGANYEFEKYVTQRISNDQARAILIPFIHTMDVIKARTHGCVRNDSETHSTGATGLHFRYHSLVGFTVISHTLMLSRYKIKHCHLRWLDTEEPTRSILIDCM